MPTIALVDDDRNILTSVSIALENEGFRIQSYTQQEGGAFRWITIPEDVNMIGDEVFDPVQMHKLYDIGQRMALQEPRWLTQLPGRRPDP